MPFHRIQLEFNENDVVLMGFKATLKVVYYLLKKNLNSLEALINWK